MMIISIVAAATSAAVTFNLLDCVEGKIAAKHAAKKAAKAAAQQEQEEPAEEPAPAPAYQQPVQAPFQQAPVEESEHSAVDPATDPSVGEQIANAIASVQDAIVNTDEDDADEDDDTEAEESDNAEDNETQFSFVVGDVVTVSNPVTVKGTRFGGNPETKYKIISIDFDTGNMKITKGPKKRVFEVNPEEAGLKKV